MDHQKLVKEITQELYEDENILALILFGSVSRNEENSNSDIDLMAITEEMHFQARHEVRYGITIEFHEMHLDFLKNFIDKKEISIPTVICEGILLFSKISEIEPLIIEAKKVVENYSTVSSKWEKEDYVLRKRFELTDIYKDLLDIDDEISFNYVVSLLITNVMPMLNELYNLRKQSKKKSMMYLKSQRYDCYAFVEILLGTSYSITEKREAAKNLIEFVLKEHGGILEGDFVLFRIDKISDLK